MIVWCEQGVCYVAVRGPLFENGEVQLEEGLGRGRGGFVEAMGRRYRYMHGRETRKQRRRRELAGAGWRISSREWQNGRPKTKLQDAQAHLTL